MIRDSSTRRRPQPLQPDLAVSPYRKDSAVLPPPRPARRLAAPGGSYLAVLRARELFIDSNYQRPLDHHRVDALAAEFNPGLLGILEVSARSDGRYAVIDGHHRLAALRDLDCRSDETLVACHVHLGLDPAGEAALFREFNRSRRALSGWESWRAQVFAGDRVASSIGAVLDRHQIRLSDADALGRMTTVRACEEVFAYGASELLENVLDVVLRAWGWDQHALYGDVLVGLALVLVTNPSAEREPLIRMLRATTPSELASQAEQARGYEAGSKSRLLAVVTVQLYNRQVGPQLSAVPSPQRCGRMRKHRTLPTGKQAELAERRQTVAELTKQGHSAASIALRLNIDRRQIVRDRRANRSQEPPS